MFTDRHNGILVSNAALQDGQWHAGEEKGTRSANGWDSLSIPYRIMSGGVLTLDVVASAFPIGQKLISRNFWTQGLGDLVCRGSGFWELMVHYKGLAGTQPIVVTYGSSGNEQSASPARINGIDHEKVSIHQNAPTCTVRYIQLTTTLGAALGQTEKVGTSQVPPSAPDSPPNFWDTIAEPVYHHPNGWVLMGSDVVPLPGTTVGLVSDSYQHQQALTPG